MLRSGASSFYEADGLGSITSLSDSSAAIANSYTYDAFGDAVSVTGMVVNPYRYTARDYDSETGLFYYRARYYDPATSRFLSEDPIGFWGGRNFYRYALNNPVVFGDPSGEWPSVADVIEGIAKAAPDVGIGAGFGAEIATGSSAGPIGGLLAGGAFGAYILYHDGPRLCEAYGWTWCSPSPQPGRPPQPAPKHKPNGRAGGCDDDNDCDKQWADAYDRCRELLAQPNPPIGLVGGKNGRPYTNLQDCARGFVSEECGGNPVDWGKKGKK